MKRVVGTILLVIYAIIAITVTVLLLSYNEYNCSEIGGYTVFIVNDDSLEPEYKQGSILLIKSTSDKNVQIGDEMFLYKVINSQEYELVSRTLQGKAQQGNHITYEVENDEKYANDYFIGKASDTKVIEGWGYLLSVLESKWGYLFCVVIVSLLLFLQEVFELTMEIKYGGNKAQNNNSVNAVEVEGDSVETRATRKTRTASASAGATGKVARKTTSSSGTRASGSNSTTKTATRKTGSASATGTTTRKAKSSSTTRTVKKTTETNHKANVEEE